MRWNLTGAREAAAVARPELADAIRAFQFRDLRAKAATDKEERSGMSAAQDQLVHATTMTAHDVRNRRGKLVRLVKLKNSTWTAGRLVYFGGIVGRLGNWPIGNGS